MDWFQSPAPYSESKLFLEDVSKCCDALVVSVDHLCYGSLLASREHLLDAETALSRLELLRDIHDSHPEVPILAFSIIMRSSISTMRSSDINAYNAMTRFSYYSALFEQNGSKKAAEEAEKARSEIPEAVLEEYHKTRERNFLVNMECLNMKADEVFDSLLLLQEDSEAFGFHKKEQVRLEKIIADRSLDGVWIQNGADEGGSISVMKALGGDSRLRLEYLDEDIPSNFIAKYEDRPFIENIEGHISYIGMKKDSSSHYVLAVATPYKGNQKDMMHNGFYSAGVSKPDGDESDWLHRMALKVSRLVASGDHVYLLDVSCANGGNIDLMKALSRRMPLTGLSGYSSWNTASNSLGTSIAQLMSDQIEGKSNNRFLLKRLVEDLVYQPSIRGKLNELLLSKGWDSYNLSDDETLDTEQELSRMMNEYMVYENFPCLIPGFTVSLPWNRTFEIDVRICQ